MLSILIPTFNFDPTALVEELNDQCKSLNISFEILIADDNPESSLKDVYERLNAIPHVTAVINPGNLGRRGNRDYLASKARYEYLLFLDEDAVITSRLFVQKYIDACKPGMVVCGGVDYCTSLPKIDRQKLRYRYGVRREVMAASDRNSTPYSSFITFNFLIPKDIYLKLPLHREIQGYGHEDTLMGYDLKYLFVPVLHIENAACHSQIDDNDVFLSKTQEALQNLSRMIASGKVDEDVQIFKLFTRIRTVGINVILRVMYSLVGREIEKYISNANPPLWVFDLYRIMYLSYIQPQITTPGAWK